VLYGMADTLLQAQTSPSMRDTAAALREQTLRLNSMVGNLLEMASCAREYSSQP
jgi:K+-sensing histidine kinase KdpD